MTTDATRWYVATVQLSDFQFELPPGAIARYPSERRDGARLMRLARNGGAIDSTGSVPALLDCVRPGDCWVINDTRVRAARLHVRKPTGAKIELLVTTARGEDAEAIYRASKPLKAHQELIAERSGDRILVAENLGGGCVALKLPEPIDVLLERAGEIPLPPYLGRAPEPSDLERYQTVYAEEPGAVAAPTAGLHFTRELMGDMTARGASFARVTLHVGPGTFRPIRSADIREHQLDSEQYRVSAQAAETINAARRVVAVGTTCVRVLESCCDPNGLIEPGCGDTALYVTPGYSFRRVDALMTNFHLPGSSLLVLVAAFCGLEATLAAYRRAVEEGFRFYSYGDVMFIS